MDYVINVMVYFNPGAINENDVFLSFLIFIYFFLSNLYPNTINYHLWPKFYFNTIHYGFWPDFPDGCIELTPGES